MLFRTHLVTGIFFILLFLGLAQNKIVFIIFGLIGIIIPDLDTKYSKFGKHIVFRPFQFFVTHRGLVHSLSFGLLVSIFLAVIFPVSSLGFFIGFSSHIIGDSFTREGISPFWPLKKRSYGFINTGETMEKLIFYFLLFLDSLIIIFLVSRVGVK